MVTKILWWFLKILKFYFISRIPTAMQNFTTMRWGNLSPHMQRYLSNVHSACFGGSSNTLPIGRRTDFYAQYVKRRSFMQGCAFWGVTKTKALPIFTRTWLRCRNSVCRLSSVTLVHPTQEVEAFGNISSRLCTLAILWPPCKILRK